MREQTYNHKSQDERHKHRKQRHDKKKKKHHHQRRSSSEDRRKYQRQNAQYQDKKQIALKQQQSLKLQKPQIIKQLPCWSPSGILLQFYNARDGVNLKFHEPPEARIPTDTWKMYIFKGQQVSTPISLTASCYLIGKDERICDILCLNPSISRQHAVIQFRLISKMNIEGGYSESIKPYIMDLGSTNGTILEDKKIQPSRYFELLHKDVLKFGFSDRQYVVVKDQTRQETTNLQQQYDQ